MDTHPQGIQEQGDHLSYLLRLWRESDEGKPVWRASLKRSRTGERVGFGSLEELFEFLRGQTGKLPEVCEDREDGKAMMAGPSRQVGGDAYGLTCTQVEDGCSVPISDKQTKL